MGDAKGEHSLPRQATLDFVAYRRSHPRRLQQPSRRGGIRQPLSRRTLPRHRRLDSRDERHAALLPQIFITGQGAVNRARSDAHARANRQSAPRNSQFRAHRLLGTEDRLSRHHLQRHIGPLRHRRKSRRSPPADNRTRIHSEIRNQKAGQGISPETLRPNVAPSGMQQTLGLDRRRHSFANSVALRKESNHLPPR